jgi:hypothetical protein
MNDARSLGKEDTELQITAGTGVQPEIKTIFKDSNTVSPTGNFTVFPVIGLTGKYQLDRKQQLLFGVHVPISFSCLGLRAGYQISIISSKYFAWALGGMLGTVFTKDSLLGSDLSKPTNNFWHGDVFNPITISFNKDFAISITPRYSLARFAVREYYDSRFPIQKLYFEGKILSLGVHNKHLNIEASYFFDAPIKFQFGIGYKISDFY